jgi:ABC-2 type transport system ATP-binding protein
MTRNRTPHQTGPAIRTEGLTRHFTRHKKTVEAVRGLDLEVARGEVVAFLGHNGAGHTQRGRDELVSQGRAFGLSRAAAYTRAEELLEVFDLTELAMRPVSTLSGGQRRRLDVAIGLVHAPTLLFLDEPSTGLDPQNRANLQEQVRRLHDEQGTTIVLTTHYLEEADAIADRVVVIDHGQVIADDTASRLKSALGDRVTLGFETETAATTAAWQADVVLGSGAQVERTGTVVRVRTPHGAEVAPGLVTELAWQGVPVTRMEVASATLDDVFLELTGRSLRESNDSSTDTTEEAAA